MLFSEITDEKIDEYGFLLTKIFETVKKEMRRRDFFKFVKIERKDDII